MQRLPWWQLRFLWALAMSSLKSFSGKLALITGGSSGIGLALGKALSSLGASVWLLARRKAQLDVAYLEVSSLRIDPFQRFGVLVADITQEKVISAVLSDFIGLTGVPDYLFNNAGIALPGLLTEMDGQHFRDIMNVNYFGMVNTTRAILPGMIRRASGHIINISSVFGYLALQGYSAYAASKYAVRGFSDALRLEVRSKGVRVSIVFPDDTDTPQLAEEIKHRPEVVKIVGGDGENAMSPEKVAADILRGVARKEYIITPGLRNSLFYRAIHTTGNLIYPILDFLSNRAEDQIKRKKDNINEQSDY